MRTCCPVIKAQLTLSDLQKRKHCESVIIYTNYSTKSLFLSHAGDSLIHHRCHFGQMVHSMCNVQILIMKGIEHLAEEEPVAEESLTCQFVPVFLISVTSGLIYLCQTQGQGGASSIPKTFTDCLLPTRTLHELRGGCHVNRWTCMFLQLLRSLSQSSGIQKGISSARSDNTKSLKGVVLDWILLRDKATSSDMPPDMPSTPKPTHLLQNVKTNQGFYHPVTGALLCPADFNYKDAAWVLYIWSFDMTYQTWFSVCAQLVSGELVVSGDQWLLLVYAKGVYDPEESWDGLFRNKLLVWVSCTHSFLTHICCLFWSEQAYKHIFTLSSSVEKEVKAIRSGNARIYGMTRITTASLAYIVTQAHLLMIVFLHHTPDHVAAPLCIVVLLGYL